MAFRTLILCCGLFLATLVTVAPGSACFGPKLYVGVGQGPEAEVMFALVTLYTQEKTGVESLRVDLEQQKDPLVELREERLDLTFIPSEEAIGRETLLALPEYPALVAGMRPLEELQFTTVVPAIRKLSGLLKAEDVALLVAQVKSGESAMVAVRRLFMERRWI